MNNPQRRIASCTTCGEEPVAEHNLAAPESHEPADKCPQVDIVRESDKEHHAHAMGDEELCTFITTALAPAKRIIRDNLAYIAEARNRFAQPGRRVPVPEKPTWGKWIQQNLGISDRHVRRLLAEQREPKVKDHKSTKREPRVEVESAAIIFGNRGLEMARKLRDGDLDTAKKIASDMLEADFATGSDRIAVLPEAIAVESKSPVTPLLQVVESGAEPISSLTSAPAAIAPSAQSSLPLPRSGAWIELANNVIALCGEHFNTALGGLDPHDAANVFGKVAQRLAQTYCRYSDDGAMEMRVTVEYVGRRRPKNAKEIQQESSNKAIA